MFETAPTGRFSASVRLIITTRGRLPGGPVPGVLWPSGLAVWGEEELQGERNVRGGEDRTWGSERGMGCGIGRSVGSRGKEDDTQNPAGSI
jgi:hypothetical protein